MLSSSVNYLKAAIVYYTHCFAAGRGPGEGAEGEVRGVGGGGGRGRGLHQPRGRERVRAGDRLQAEEQVLLLPPPWLTYTTTPLTDVLQV